jgi:N-acetylated-alpha-linked acidic dipeptidase
VFDNFAWYKKFGVTNFLYSQEIARVFGLQVLRMAEAEVLPYDYEGYAREITGYVEAAQRSANDRLGDKAPSFDATFAAARRLAQAGAAINALRARGVPDPGPLNSLLRRAESALLLPEGLPRRPWFKHAIYAPADLKGYSASVIPGVNEAIERGDLPLAIQQVRELTAALNRAADLLESYKGGNAAAGK